MRRDAGIEQPAGPEGKRVGVPEYQQTAALWARGVLQHEFGVIPSDIHWFMERTAGSAVMAESTGFSSAGRRPPHRHSGDKHRLDAGCKGELDATVHYLTENNLVDRSRVELIGSGKMRRLFPDQLAKGRASSQRPGLFPINHGVVVRR